VSGSARKQSILRTYIYKAYKWMCQTYSMTSPDFRDGSPRDRGARAGRARDVSNAVAERERGRRRLNATTATVGFASVAAAGVVAVSLPGSTHAAVTHPGKSSASAASGSGTSNTGTSNAGTSNAGTSDSGSTSSGSSSNSSNSNSSNSSGNLQAPANNPVQSSGGQATSGGTSSW
jgi:hypothetical protein